MIPGFQGTVVVNQVQKRSAEPTPLHLIGAGSEQGGRGDPRRAAPVQAGRAPLRAHQPGW